MRHGKVLDTIRQLIDNESELVGQDEVRFPYQTQMYWAIKKM